MSLARNKPRSAHRPAPGLGPTGLRIVRKLVQAEGKFVKPQDLMRAVYEPIYGPNPDRWPKSARDSARTIIHRLRYQHPGSIGTSYGLGYCLRVDSSLYRLYRNIEGELP